MEKAENDQISNAAVSPHTPNLEERSRRQKKMLENSGKKLTFSAELASAKPQDAGRKFIVGFQLADDTLSVYEPPQAGSGFNGGKFLQLSTYINPTTGKNYKAGDLKIGAVICVQGHRFRLVGANGFTMRYIEDNPAKYPDTTAAST